MKKKTTADATAMLEANYATVVQLLEKSESEKKQLQQQLAEASSLQERVVAAEAAVEAARQGAQQEMAAAAEREAAAKEEADGAQAASEASLARARADAEETQRMRSELEAAESSAATARATAEKAEASRAKAEQELSVAKRQVEEERAAAAQATAQAEAKLRQAEEAQRSREAEEAARTEEVRREATAEVEKLRATCAELERELDELRPAAAAAGDAEARAAKADLAMERVRDETKKAVSEERQRAAGMLYKEALQASMLEEQTQQIEALTAELSEAKQHAAERNVRRFHHRLPSLTTDPPSRATRLARLSTSPKISVLLPLSTSSPSLPLPPLSLLWSRRPSPNATS